MAVIDTTLAEIIANVIIQLATEYSKTSQHFIGNRSNAVSITVYEVP